MTLITFFDYLDQIAAEDENFCLAVRYMEPNGDTYDTCQPEPERLGEAGARRTGRRLAVRRYRGRNT